MYPANHDNCSTKEPLATVGNKKLAHVSVFVAKNNFLERRIHSPIYNELNELNLIYMPLEFRVGTFSRSLVSAEVISLQKPEDTECLKHGDHVEHWGHVFEWDEHYLTASQLQPWRVKGDPLCDKALEEVFSDINVSVGHDLLECVLRKAAENPSGPAASFLTEVSRIPPERIVASPEELRNAHKFYLKNSVAIMQSLNYFTLAGGFASPGITRVLHSVSYLVESKKDKTEQSQTTKDRTYLRLAETFQFVLEVMGCTTQSDFSQDNFHNYLFPGGDGWKAVLRIRLLHGVARRRALKKLKDAKTDEIPINQEDLAATLGGFSAAPLLCLPRQYPVFLRNKTSIMEEAAFVALWRHVGFYLGVDSYFLLNHFSSPEVATRFLISIICHLLPSKVDSNTFDPPTVPLLQAIANRPPFPKSFEYNSAVSRKLLGNPLSTHLGLPPTTSFRLKLRITRDFFIVQLPVLFGQVYSRKGWDERRLSLTKMGLERLVRFQLGLRQTSYRPRNEQGELDEKVSRLEHSELEPGGREKFIKGWRDLMIEMTLNI
ncbi:hypothetical protein Clacol_009124 [Clathrus columnatus]|uniref:ER-bound oxygenase mpaB/mpaB'/Rubber oxygenase catalytic domain-containing protein n=1 Tax=Clathrus columnatus TaxID=1419009 RepID=A0AAV5AR53_9AGAM|nr:hypothetical protein Clacol_009124 [Clathrus columnatus]